MGWFLFALAIVVGVLGQAFSIGAGSFYSEGKKDSSRVAASLGMILAAVALALSFIAGAL